MPCLPLWPCNKMLNPNFQSIIFQTNNGCSLFHLQYFSQASAFRNKLRKYFCVVHSDCITACPFSIKKCAKMSIFYVKTVKTRWRFFWRPRPFGLRRLGVKTPRPPVVLTPLSKPGCATGTAYCFCVLFLILVLTERKCKTLN